MKIRELISEKQIEERISELANEINKDFDGEEIVIVSILKGSFIFTADLVRKITVPCTMDFVSLSSYGNSLVSSGVVKILKDLDEEIEGKNVIIVEDIIDTGRTLSFFVDVLKARNPKSIKICTILDKPDRRIDEVNVDYIGFKIPDEFVVGYGLDFEQTHRNLPYIGVVEGKGE